MHTPFLIGVLSTAALLAIAIAGFFARVWRMRPEAREYLYCALLSLAIASYHGLQAMAYAHMMGLEPPLSMETGLRLIPLPVSLGVALLLHFALRYGQVARSDLLMAPVYLLTAVFMFLGLEGKWWASWSREPLLVERWGFEIHTIELRYARVTTPFFVEALCVAVATVALVARRWWRERQSGVAAVGGAAVLVLAVLNDLSLAGFGALPTAPMVAFGLLALGYGVAMTVVIRYGKVSTALEQSNSALQERSLELESSYRELKRTQLRLVRSEQLAVVGELSAVIAHEVRNPLAIVNNAVASLRKRGTRGEERRVLLNIISEEMSRLDHLVSRMLDYARPLSPSRDEVDLDLLLHKALRLVGPQMSARVEGSGGVDLVGDTSLLRLAFDNLVQNSVQAGAQELRVAVGANTDVVTISFQDDGEGMGEEAMTQALSPFFTTRPTGTGLGLPVVARIAQAHGGDLVIESEQGKGTAVICRLSRQGPPPLVPPRSRGISVFP